MHTHTHTFSLSLILLSHCKNFLQTIYQLSSLFELFIDISRSIYTSDGDSIEACHKALNTLDI